MNFAPIPTAAHAAEPFRAPDQASSAALILDAAARLLPALSRGQSIDASALRAAMTEAFGASDAEGAWVWKDAYDSCEVASVLFLRKFGPAMRRSAKSPAALLAMLQRVASLLPAQTRRSQESQALQRGGCRRPGGPCHSQCRRRGTSHGGTGQRRPRRRELPIRNHR
jgi:hypothetical protein